MCWAPELVDMRLDTSRKQRERTTTVDGERWRALGDGRYMKASSQPWERANARQSAGSRPVTSMCSQ